MENLTIKARNSESRMSFEQLVQKHNGVWGGCWCTAFHPKSTVQERSPEPSKSKKKRVEEGCA